MGEERGGRPTYDELLARVAELEALVERLTAKSKTSSRNSSKPPSSDPAWAKQAKKAKSGEGRKRGGQPGHTKGERKLRPPDQVNCVKDVVPTCCESCGGGLEGQDPIPTRHQVVDLPSIQLTCHEWRLHALPCACGAVTRAKLPAGVPRRAFGPKIEATIALLTGHHRISRRDAQEFLRELVGLEISVGAISNIEARVSAALESAHSEALIEVQDAASKHADETGWRQAGEKSWLWVGKSEKAAVFLIRDSRSASVAKELLGESPTGIQVTDRFSSYTWVDIEQRQLCWAHLFRDFQKIVDGGGEGSKRIGEELRLLGGALFVWFHKYRDGEIPTQKWHARADEFRKDIKRLLKEGAQLEHWRTPGICQAILSVEQALWTFVRTEGVEPTNNDAERAIRRAVIWRKTSFGTQSDRGSRFAERMLTCAATLRIHGKSVLAYLSHACAAGRDRRQPASLFA